MATADDRSVNDLFRLPACIRDILEERAKQDRKWGEQKHEDLYWLGILSEEVGEVAKEIIEGKSPRTELIQVAAVAVAWLECIARRWS